MVQKQKDRSIDLEHPKNQWGEEPDHEHLKRLDDEAPGKSGKTTPPSGQGGATPHDGVSYQDYFAPNPEPSESAAKKGEENDEIQTGDTNPVIPVDKQKKSSSK